MHQFGADLADAAGVRAGPGPAVEERALTWVKRAVARIGTLAVRTAQDLRYRLDEQSGKGVMVGIGMQIDYLGCSATAPLEAEAAMQLVRLQRFGAQLSNCHLAIEALRLRSGKPLYDVRLDLVTATQELKPIGRYASESAEEAVRCAFDAAERTLQTAASAQRR